MDFLKISKFTENHFDQVIEKIGGRRFSVDDSKEGDLNCDYIFDDALVELKLIEESVVDKETKRSKIADIFGADTKTVVIDPERLNAEGKAKYYRVLETPIKNALKKSSKQLQAASLKSQSGVKITIIINNGLSLMMPDEFEAVAIKCAKNDTSGIDILLVGGNYFYSDKFEHFAIFPLKEIYLNGKYRTDIVDSIRAGWNDFLCHFMNEQFLDFNKSEQKEPLQDISFFRDDILYVKPPPKIGSPSSFWPNGIRPREDTTGMDTCPTIAIVLPTFDASSYKVAKENLVDDYMLQESFPDYLNWVSQEIENISSLLRPSITILIPTHGAPVNYFQELCNIAAEIFNNEVNKIIDMATSYNEEHLSLNYILLNCAEIGIDKKNDLAFIDHIVESPGFEKETSIIYGERMKFEYALALASAYCIKVGADCVYYLRDTYYKWT